MQVVSITCVFVKLHEDYKYFHSFIYYSIDANIGHHAMLNISTMIGILWQV